MNILSSTEHITQTRELNKSGESNYFMINFIFTYYIYYLNRSKVKEHKKGNWLRQRTLSICPHYASICAERSLHRYDFSLQFSFDMHQIQQLGQKIFKISLYRM